MFLVGQLETMETILYLQQLRLRVEAVVGVALVLGTLLCELVALVVAQLMPQFLLAEAEIRHRLRQVKATTEETRIPPEMTMVAVAVAEQAQ